MANLDSAPRSVLSVFGARESGTMFLESHQCHTSRVEKRVVFMEIHGKKYIFIDESTQELVRVYI